ncbi:hydrolase [Elusimicrobiota bacterium]
MRHETILERDKTVLIVVDIQEKLLGVYGPPMRARVLTGARKLMAGAKDLGLPVLLTEQYPQGLGQTARAVKGMLGDEHKPIEKTDFSCCGDAGFMKALKATGRKQALVCGIEAHVCVQQTALDLRAQGFLVHVCRDAIGSRKREDYKVGISRMERAGVVITTVESAFFELLENCRGEDFRKILKIVK